jgi:hypothetical protein
MDFQATAKGFLMSDIVWKLSPIADDYREGSHTWHLSILSQDYFCTLWQQLWQLQSFVDLTSPQLHLFEMNFQGADQQLTLKVLWEAWLFCNRW